MLAPIPSRKNTGLTAASAAAFDIDCNFMNEILCLSRVYRSDLKQAY